MRVLLRVRPADAPNPLVQWGVPDSKVGGRCVRGLHCAAAAVQTFVREQECARATSCDRRR